VSRFYLSEQTNNANFNFHFGDGPIEAQNLVAQNIFVYNLGYSDMIVNPFQSVTGVLNSTGNLALKNFLPLHTSLDALYRSCDFPIKKPMLRDFSFIFS
jgi:hypothetical protein